MDDKNDKKSIIVLLVVVAMTFMATLDSSIVNIALPVISKELNVSNSMVSWVVISYSIIICATLLFFGRLGDVLGKTKVFQAGTLIFVLSSFLCGISYSFTGLIVFRFIQGVGAAAYMANNHGIITEMYPVGKRGKALGILVTAVALGNMVGPSVGGLILSKLSWNFIFYINIPIGIIVFLLGLKYLSKSKSSSEKIDVMGAVLQFAATVLLFGSLNVAQQLGLKNGFIIGSLVLAVIFIILFIYVEIKQKQPLLDLEIFCNARFSSNLICAFASFVCLAASYILVPFYLQNALQLSPFKCGIFMVLQPLILAVAAPLFGTISDKVESEKVVVMGLLTLGLAFFLMSRLNENTNCIWCALFIGIIALGQGIFQPANNALVMSSCAREKLGIVGSVNSLVRNLGQIVGITLSTTCLYGFMSLKMGSIVYDYVEGRDDIFIYGMSRVYLIIFIICLISAFLIIYRRAMVKKKS